MGKKGWEPQCHRVEQCGERQHAVTSSEINDTIINTDPTDTVHKIKGTSQPTQKQKCRSIFGSLPGKQEMVYTDQ